MDTPKVKQEKSKANKERKKQIRVYQSSIDKNCGIVLSDEQFTKFNDLLKEAFKDEPSEKKNETTEQSKEDIKRKKSRKETRKTLKNKDLIMGLNEVLKSIPKGTISVICIEEEFAANTKAIVHKLASEHRIPTFEGKLSKLKAMFNISQLTIVAFHTNTRQESSKFFPVTQFLFDNLRNPIPKVTNVEIAKEKNIDKEWKEIKAEVEDVEESIPVVKVPKYDPSVSFKYVENREERYRQKMLGVLTKSLSIVDESNYSVINLVDESPQYFPAYSLPKSFELKIEQELTKGDKEQRSHSIAEQIYDFDSSQRTSASQKSSQSNSQQKNGQKRSFQEPRLLKAEVPVSQSKKQKKKTNKAANK